MKTLLLGLSLTALVGLAWLAVADVVPHSARAEFRLAEASPKPVEPDMHEFMEYLFQPTYKRLQATMASAPADNSGWKAIKADALVLAEGGNLLLSRTPEDEAADWNALSVAVRDLGGQLYQAGKSKDFAAANQHYRAMILKCNACHDQFAGGEHQLEP